MANEPESPAVETTLPKWLCRSCGREIMVPSYCKECWGHRPDTTSPASSRAMALAKDIARSITVTQLDWIKVDLRYDESSDGGAKALDIIAAIIERHFAPVPTATEDASLLAEIEAIEAYCAAATDGWYVDEYTIGGILYRVFDKHHKGVCKMTSGDTLYDKPHADLIAKARTSLPRLCAALRERIPVRTPNGDWEFYNEDGSYNYVGKDLHDHAFEGGVTAERQRVRQAVEAKAKVQVWDNRTSPPTPHYGLSLADVIAIIEGEK